MFFHSILFTLCGILLLLNFFFMWLAYCDGLFLLFFCCMLVPTCNIFLSLYCFVWLFIIIFLLFLYYMWPIYLLFLLSFDYTWLIACRYLLLLFLDGSWPCFGVWFVCCFQIAWANTLLNTAFAVLRLHVICTLQNHHFIVYTVKSLKMDIP